MIKNDTKAIKYITDEMDPAEIVEFEREMRSNPDLRIEVESMRRMRDRLRCLPNITPPKQISDSILTMAADESVRNGASGLKLFLSAAVILFGLTAGSLFIENPLGFSNGSESNQDVNISSSALHSDLNFEEADQIDIEKVKPWVDRNNILRLGGFDSGLVNPGSADLYEKNLNLKLSDSSLSRGSVFRSLQLTGSNQR